MWLKQMVFVALTIPKPIVVELPVHCPIGCHLVANKFFMPFYLDEA